VVQSKQKWHRHHLFGPAKQGITLGQDAGGGSESINKQKELFKDYKSQIDAISTILNVPKREKEFRLFSNTGENSNYETSTTTVGINTPDMYFISNNYFYNISKFISLSNNTEELMIGTDNEGKVPLVLGWNDSPNEDDIEKQKVILSKRFVTKYLWMLGNKERVITIFSIQSFYNLQKSGLFKEYDFELNSDSEFDNFVSNWNSFSESLFNDLDINTNEDKLKFSQWLFKVSMTTTDIKNISDLLQSGNKAVILWGPPGTGKTYESMEIVKELLEIDDLNDKEIEQQYLFSKQAEHSNKKGYYEIVQFHPNYTYQDFIGGISPNIDGKESKEISYILRDGIFKKFCDEATKNENQKFIFIIDEINRAELSAVFGELLYALEYRGKLINLPHFGEFTIPKNVYIIGTMNNVDKSLVTFDLALRRRFGFFKLMPKLEVIQDVLSDIVDADSLSTYYEKCKTLNKKIKTELDLGEDYQIGQAYFLKIKDFLSKDKDENSELNQVITSFELEKLWVYNIEPLLEEYLGMNIEDENVVIQLKRLKEEFLKDN
jgi:Cdc6-like AAA superfamily ATPase